MTADPGHQVPGGQPPPACPPAAAQEVLDFWFLRPGEAGHGQARDVWFRKDPVFDATVLQRFGAVIEAALAGGCTEWDRSPRGSLARILVLDQFTRNAFRDTPRAFAGDALALKAARRLVDAGQDAQLAPLERWFAYMPFEHAEDLAAQERAVALFSRLAADHDGFGEALDYAVRHRDVIARFGRFPHRNALLARASTAEELDFLRQPGSRF